MKTIQAVFEKGVFRPKEPIDLPEKTTVEFEPRVVGRPEEGASLDAVYAILSRRYDSGDKEGAARHNEHQP